MYAGEVSHFHSPATPAQTYLLPGYVSERNMDVILCPRLVGASALRAKPDESWD